MGRSQSNLNKRIGVNVLNKMSWIMLLKLLNPMKIISYFPNITSGGSIEQTRYNKHGNYDDKLMFGGGGDVNITTEFEMDINRTFYSSPPIESSDIKMAYDIESETAINNYLSQNSQSGEERGSMMKRTKKEEI